MNNRRIFLSGFAAIAGLALTGCEKLKQAGEAAKILASQGKGGKRWPNYRYRLTIEVETPEGLKTGSSVIEVRTAMGGPNDIPMSNYLNTAAYGEAVVVDLGERGTFFSLLRGERAQYWAHFALFNALPRRSTKEINKLAKDIDPFVLDMDALVKLPMGKIFEVPREVAHGTNRGKPILIDNYPLFVCFSDVRNPATIEKIDDTDLAAIFGQGVRLKRITVARTDEAVTRKISTFLPWLKSTRGRIVKYPITMPRADIPPLHRLIESDFITLEG